VCIQQIKLITVFTRSSYIFLLHFRKLHIIYIRVILILSSQLLLCILIVSSIQIYPPNPVSSVYAQFCTISTSAVSPQGGSSCCCNVTTIRYFLLFRSKYPSQLIILENNFYDVALI
jgi:hypothetical protein